MADVCPHCKGDVAPHLDRCVHCDGDVGKPNVRAAAEASEVAALQARLDAALADADHRGCRDAVDRFMQAAADSKAVICKTGYQLNGIVEMASGSWLIQTYRQQVESGRRPPDEPEWDWVRSAERRWFPNYTEKIHYGALSLGGAGVTAWGEMTLVLSEEQIGTRTTVGEGNVVHLGWAHPANEPLPRGRRATWGERAKLCVAKLSGRIAADTTTGEFATLLLAQPDDKKLADFVEVHLYGSLTLDKVACVRVPREVESEWGPLWRRLRERDIAVEFFDEAAA